MVGAIRPYAIQVTPKGDAAIVGFQGGGQGDVDTISVIDLEGKTPRIVHTLDVGQIVEGLAISFDGKYVALTAQNGSNHTQDFPFYNAHGLVVVFRINGTNLTEVAEGEIGVWDQGICWSRDGKTLLVEDMAGHALDVVKFNGNSLRQVQEIKVPGGPAGLRTAEH
jgi:DNA-binding beta-propeller fold protein YncE